MAKSKRKRPSAKRQHGPFRNHRWQGAFTATKKRRAVRGEPPAHSTMHQGDRDAPPDLENGLRHQMARPPSRSFRAVQILAESLAPGLVFAGRIQKALRGHAKARARAQRQPLQMGIGTASRLRAARQARRRLLQEHERRCATPRRSSGAPPSRASSKRSIARGSGWSRSNPHPPGSGGKQGASL